MTLDDESSVYVGGIPYDSSEDSLRKIFSLYGAVVAVKIINDRSTKGKCYAFVTFTNPRSAIDAIDDMDGRTIEGRVVRVNEVKSRGGRLSFGRDSFRHMDRNRGRERERDFDGHDTDRQWDSYSERSRERDRSRDHEHDRERGQEHSRDYDRARDHLIGKDQALDRNLEDDEQERSRNHDLNLNGERGMDGTDDYDGQELTRKRNSSSNDHRNREFSSESDYDSYGEVDAQLEISIQQYKELKEEISRMEQKLDEKKQVVLDLQKKSKKLEDSLTAAKKLTSQHKMQLTKLHKCYLQVRDYTEKLKSSEQELQSLVDSAYKESDFGDDIGLRHGVLINGN